VIYAATREAAAEQFMDEMRVHYGWMALDFRRD
jgi:hypothetical protein